MRIAFDATSCAKEQRGGIARYGWGLLGALARVAPQHEYVVAVRPNRWFARRLLDGILPHTSVKLLVSATPGLTLGDLDVFHGLGVRLPRGGGFPKLVMLHDINVFEFPELSNERWRASRQARIRQTLQRADLVLSYSEQGRRALVDLLDVPYDAVRVVPCGLDVEAFRAPPAARIAEALRRHEIEGPFVLNVGAFGKRKNQRGLLAAFVRAELPKEWVLVLGGPRGDGAQELRAQAAELGLPADRLRLPGWIEQEDYVALLAGCGIYCCSSLHEGFGIPVAEAQAAGAPVASSDRGALPETVGDCGVLFDPEDRDDIARALSRLARDGALRADLARRGPERARRLYSWERIAEQTLAVYEELAASR